MAKDLASNPINGELFSYPDWIFTDQAVTASGTVTSNPFRIGGTLDALELVGIAGAGLTDVTDVVYSYAETEDGTYTDISIPFDIAGEDFFRYVPDHKKPMWAKIGVTGGVAGAGVFSVNIGSVRK